MAIDTITVTGVIGTPITHTVTNEGLAITSFRLASQHRKYDRNAGSWVDGETNWFTVSAFRTLALNAAASLDKGQRIVVTGRLRVRTWIVADSLGHDLLWGTTAFTRNPRPTEADAAGRDANFAGRGETPF